ncbi:MAG: hypothetical protein VBE63_18375 [Lamprobacter sp.]|uniref:hypothetical protein n=1 Tax=Lamprobacter sp. TaxID=3100796 RepID=UPI002B263D2D|nr:hypothetical protein [Lamprobacter sp.]MEA3641882.1 hypothetical protein [Lamprobacter sp.]
MQHLPQKTPVEQARTLDQWFMVFWICFAVGIPTSVIIVGIAGVIAGVVFLCLILYKLWELIPEKEAKTTPGKAVGFLFIPLFNLYWNFIAINGLAEALNKELSRTNEEELKIDTRLTLAYCIVACVSVVTIELVFAGIILAIAQIIILILAVKQMKDAGKSLILSKSK